MGTLWGERLSAVAFIALAVFMGVLAWEFPAGGDQFPLFVSACMILIGCLMLITSWLTPKVYRLEFPIDLSWDAWTPIVVMALAVVYVIAAFRIGYFVSTIAFLVGVPFLVGLRRPIQVAIGTAACIVFIVALFRYGLRAQLPSGLLF